MEHPVNARKDPLSLLLDSDQEAKRFFDALPLVTQETIRQSGISFENSEDLKSCAEHFMSGE